MNKLPLFNMPHSLECVGKCSSWVRKFRPHGTSQAFLVGTVFLKRILETKWKTKYLLSSSLEIRLRNRSLFCYHTHGLMFFLENNVWNTFLWGRKSRLRTIIRIRYYQRLSWKSSLQPGYFCRKTDLKICL